MPIALSIVFIFTVIKFGICEVSKKPDTGSLYEQIELFTDAVTYIRINYVDEVSAKDLIYGALKGMLASLDPHSQFMNPDSYKEIREETKGEFGGLGIEISIRDGLLTIISPLEDTPAYKAGIKAGDRIVKIDNVSTKNSTLVDAVKKLRGKPGTEVTLMILRESEGRIFDLKITRSIIKLDSVKEAVILEDNIGYVRLSEFQERTSRDLLKEIERLKKEGMEGFVLDLRNNPGGLLEAAVEVANIFLLKDKDIVVIRGRTKDQEITYKAKGMPYTDFPIVVMVNGGSASASEIVAGALQDNKRSIVLGTKTFGKGSVQTVIPLKDKSALRLTTAKYFTPSGRAIREEGIVPDVVVEYRALPVEDTKNKKTEEVFEKLEETPKKKKDYDNQLLRAMDLLKGIRAYGRLETS